MMKEVDLDTMSKRKQGHREVRQFFQKNKGLILINV